MKPILKSVGHTCLLVCAGLLFACSSPSKQTDAVAIPSYIRNPYERLDYLVEHYWDKTDLRDSIWLQDTLALKTRFSDYFSLLSSYPHIKRKMLLKPLEHLDGVLLERVMGYYRDYYLSEPTSSVNEMSYVYLLDWARKSPKVKMELQRDANAEILRLIKNQVGYKVQNIIYQTKDYECRLSDGGKTAYRLLVLSSSGQDNYLRELSNDANYAAWVKSKLLRVTYLHLGQSAPDLEGLRQDSITAKWIEQGIDSRDSIMRYQVYKLKPNPEIYLLDREMKIILKHPTLSEVKRYLQEHGKEVQRS